MPCSTYEECVNQEKQNMLYPTDQKSLYQNKYFDDHTAATRCYWWNPINIIEGFSGPWTFEKMLKMSVVILLIILFVVLAKDFLMPKEKISFDIPEVTEGGISLEPITAAQDL